MYLINKLKGISLALAKELHISLPNLYLSPESHQALSSSFICHSLHAHANTMVIDCDSSVLQQHRVIGTNDLRVTEHCSHVLFILLTRDTLCN